MSPGTAAPRTEMQDGRPVRRRNRQLLSCAACRERKIRCDRTVPCSQCVRRGAGDSCCIEKRSRSGTHGPSDLASKKGKDDVGEIKKRLAQLETMLADQPKRQGMPAHALGNVAEHPVQVHNREVLPETGPTPQDADVEDAALVLEGLTMDGTLAFNQHRGREAMRRAIDDARDMDGRDAQRELAHEGIVDPIEYPLCAHEAAKVASCKILNFSPETESENCDTEQCPMLSACSNNSLLKLSSVTESSLGWGLGWAMAAAQEIGHFDQMQAAAKIFKSPSITPERVSVLTAIIRTLPTYEQTEALMDVYERRAQTFVHNVVHMPTMRREVQIFYALNSPLHRACATDKTETCWLGLLLMVLVIGLRFRETNNPKLEGLLGRFTDMRFASLWYSATKTVLVLSGYNGSQALSVLQTILLLMFQCPQSASHSPSLLRIAISNAQSMGLHRLGDLSNQPKPDEQVEYAVRREMAKRIWWALAICDWRNAAASTVPYVIQPHQCNTPLPGNYNHSDLMRVPFPPPHPRDELTEMSFTLSVIELSKVTRENVDWVDTLELQQATDGKPRQLSCDQVRALDVKYNAALTEAPIFSDRGVEYMSAELIEVQRWAFQQSVFNRLLQVHRIGLSKKQARNCCVELARKVLCMQKTIRSRSDLADKLVMNMLQSFNATTLLCLDLLYTPPTAIQRDTIRAEILEGLTGMCQAAKAGGLTPRGIRIVHTLLDEEQAQWEETQRREKAGAPPRTRTDFLNMALRVARISRMTEPLVSADQCEEMPPKRESTPPPSVVEMQDNPLNAFPPLQPTLTAFDPYQMGPSGFEVSNAQSPATNMDFDLQKFLENFELPASDPKLTGTVDPNYEMMQYDMSMPNPTAPAPAPVQGLDRSWSDRSDSTRTDPSVSDSLSMMVPGLSHSSSPSARSGSGSSQNGRSPSGHSPSSHMDGFWDWILSQGLRTDSPNAAPVPDMLSNAQAAFPDMFGTTQSATPALSAPAPQAGLDANYPNKAPMPNAMPNAMSIDQPSQQPVFPF